MLQMDILWDEADEGRRGWWEGEENEKEEKIEKQLKGKILTIILFNAHDIVKQDEGGGGSPP